MQYYYYTTTAVRVIYNNTGTGAVPGTCTPQEEYNNILVRRGRPRTSYLLWSSTRNVVLKNKIKTSTKYTVLNYRRLSVPVRE